MLNKRKNVLLVILVVSVVLAGAGLFFAWQEGLLFNGNQSATNGVAGELQQAKLPEPEQEKDLNYSEALGTMLPKKQLVQAKNRPDCFYNPALIEDAAGGQNDVYCVSSVKEGLFTDAKTKSLLLTVLSGYSRISSDSTIDLEAGTYPTHSHAEGLYHAILGVFSAKDKRLLTEPLELVADDGEFYFFDCQEGTRILFIGSSGGQGWFSSNAQLLRASNGRLEKVWPATTSAEELNWPGEYKSVTVNGQDISVVEYNPKFAPDNARPGEEDFRLSQQFSWNAQNCQFEEKTTPAN